MEIKTITEDGIHLYAMIGRANVRRRYRLQRVTGAVRRFVADEDGNWCWRSLSPGMSDNVRLAFAQLLSLLVGQPAPKPRLVFSR
jgi:hypothetical protein